MAALAHISLSPRSRLLTCAALTCLHGFTAACSSPGYAPEWEPVGVDGSESRVTFSTPDDTSRTSFLSRKLAVQARTSVLVSKEVHDVLSSDPSVFTAEFDGSLVQVEAKSQGSATLSVQLIERDPTTLEPIPPTGDFQADDGITLETAVATRVELVNLCGEGGLTFLTGRKDIFLGYELLDEEGEVLAGHGYYPFTAPTSQQKITLSDTSHHSLALLNTHDEPGTITITSQLEEDKSWDIQLFEEGDIDGAMVHSHRVELPGEVQEKLLDGVLGYTRPFDGENLYANSLQVLQAEPTVQNSPLCMADIPVYIESLTPDSCSIIPVYPVHEEDYQRGDLEPQDPSYSFFGVSSKDASADGCTLSITYPQGKNGQGVTTTITLPIIEAPEVMEPDMQIPEDMASGGGDGLDMAPDLADGGAEDMNPDMQLGDEMDMAPDMEEDSPDMPLEGDADMDSSTDMSDDADMGASMDMAIDPDMP